MNRALTSFVKRLITQPAAARRIQSEETDDDVSTLPSFEQLAESQHHHQAIPDGEIVEFIFSILKLPDWEEIVLETTDLEMTYMVMESTLNLLTHKRICYDYIVDEVLHDNKTTVTARSNTYTHWISRVNAAAQELDLIKVIYMQHKEMQKRRRSSCLSVFLSARSLLRKMKKTASRLFALVQEEDPVVAQYLIDHLYGPNTRICKQPVSPYILSCIARLITLGGLASSYYHTSFL